MRAHAMLLADVGYVECTQHAEFIRIRLRARSTLIQMLLHINIDGMLVIALIVHGAAGVKFSSMRRGIRLRGLDWIITSVTAILIGLVFYLAL